MREKTANKILELSREGYDKIAEDFSSTRPIFWEELNFIKGAIKEGDAVLDIGCGNGRFFEEIKGKQINYTGIDSSKNLLEKAKERFKEEAVFIESDALHLPFKEESFDVALSFAVLHHIPSQKLRNRFFEESKRVLKKDGILILTVWNLWQKKLIPAFVKYSLLRITRISGLDFKDILLNFGKHKKVRYLHAFTKKELEKLARKNGFRIKQLEVVKRKSGQSNFLLICEKI